MVYRSLLIPVLLAAAFATFVNGSSAAQAVMADEQVCFRIATPHVSHVITQDVTPEIARALGMCRAEGVLISDVMYSPLRSGDVILAINGNPVGCQSELNALLADVSLGPTLFIDVYRDGQIQRVTVQRAMEIPPLTTVLRGTSEIRGIRVASLSTQYGVMVEEVQIGTPASDLGLKTGDIILDVDGHPVHSAAEFVGFLHQLNNRHATFNVCHDSGQIDVFTIPVV